MKLIDLSHEFKENMPVYPGDEPPKFVQVSDYSKEGCFNYRINSGFHVGTHIDAPFHMIPGAKKLSEINVERFFGKGVLIDATGKKEIDVDLLERKNVLKDSIVLIMTGFYKDFGSEEYYNNFPEITEAFAKRMVELKVKIVAMDTPSPDKHPYKVHKILLKEEILIIENLTNLEELLGVDDFEVIALPAKFHSDGAPIRVVVQVNNSQ
jgi:kynurenine formamidase